MKKLGLCSLLTLALAAGFSACKKEKSPYPLDITGKWVSQSIQQKKVYQDIYQFNADSSFTQTRLLADSVTGQPLSYQYAGTGKFHLNSDKLQLYAVSIKYSGYYVALNQLTQTQQLTTPVDYKLAMADDPKSFYFVFAPCPVNASCLGQVTYYKK